MNFSAPLRSPPGVMALAYTFMHAKERVEKIDLPPGGFEALPDFHKQVQHCAITAAVKEQPPEVIKKIMDIINPEVLRGRNQGEFIIVLGQELKRDFGPCLDKAKKGALTVKFIKQKIESVRDLAIVHIGESYQFRGQGAPTVFFVVPHRDRVRSAYSVNEIFTDYFIALTRAQNNCVIVGTDEDWNFMMQPDKSNMYLPSHVSNLPPPPTSKPQKTFALHIDNHVQAHACKLHNRVHLGRELNIALLFFWFFFFLCLCSGADKFPMLWGKRDCCDK